MGCGQFATCIRLKTRHVQNPSIEPAQSARYSQSSSHPEETCDERPFHLLVNCPVALASRFLARCVPQLGIAGDCTYRRTASATPAINARMAAMVRCAPTALAPSGIQVPASPGAKTRWAMSEAAMAPPIGKIAWAMCAPAMAKCGLNVTWRKDSLGNLRASDGTLCRSDSLGTLRCDGGSTPPPF